VSDDYQSIPVAAARAAVQASGELEGIEGPLFLGDAEGDEWRPFFSKALYGKDAHPEFAKVTITRKGQKPREVVIAWDEYADQMDADPSWDAIREAKPMAVFGGEAERHSYRVAFADILAAAFPPISAPVADRRSYDDAPAAGWATVDAPPRDWFAEVKTADAETLSALTDEARAAGALAKIDGLQKAFMDRLLELEEAKRPKPSPASVPPRKPDASQGNRRRRGKR
jgi:hypothetical protein